MKTNTSIIEWATAQAAAFLLPLGDRWLHTQGVVAHAQQVGRAFTEEDRSLLIAAAYLHDIGYAPSLKVTAFHPLDGAYYLLSHGQERLASLIAYHFEAQFEAQLRGLATELSKIPREYSPVADALTYCDLLTGPTGLHISFDERLADIFQRYDKNHVVYQATRHAIPSLTRVIQRTQTILYQHEQHYQLTSERSNNKTEKSIR